MNRAGKKSKGSPAPAGTASHWDNSTSGDILDLSALFHTRVSKHAMDILRQRAAAAAMKPATFGRNLLYRSLGIIKPGSK